MPSRADYRNTECLCYKEFWFEHVPPSVHSKACEKHPKATHWVRQWTTPHVGRGSSGEPPR